MHHDLLSRFDPCDVVAEFAISFSDISCGFAWQLRRDVSPRIADVFVDRRRQHSFEDGIFFEAPVRVDALHVQVLLPFLRVQHLQLEIVPIGVRLDFWKRPRLHGRRNRMPRGKTTGRLPAVRLESFDEARMLFR